MLLSESIQATACSDLGSALIPRGPYRGLQQNFVVPWKRRQFNLLLFLQLTERSEQHAPWMVGNGIGKRGEGPLWSFPQQCQDPLFNESIRTVQPRYRCHTALSADQDPAQFRVDYYVSQPAECNS
jgi:hypothetical protein